MTDKLNTDDMDMAHIAGYYRYIDHNKHILTTGFLTETALRRYSKFFLNTQRAIEIMEKRYKELT